ncbi:MAG TPA: hypothetical protein VNF73_01015 [Candidatus Saccharimonadales bacterium]|nr:hypothetical protein [Candidatus Saccharimonadales bacterium]
MANRTNGRAFALAGAWIPIGAGVGGGFGVIYGDIASFAAAGAVVGAVLAALTVIFAIGRTRGELSLAQFAGGLLLVGALGFSLGAIFVPDRMLLYGLLAIGLSLPALIWLGFSLRSSRPRLS